MAPAGQRKVQALYGIVTAAVVVLLAFHARAEEPGDPWSGRAFALTHCAECHAVKSPEDKSPNPKAPSFVSVAATPGMTGRALAVWLQTSHPTMPNLVIADQDRDNVIAYIMSLRTPPSK